MHISSGANAIGVVFGIAVLLAASFVIVRANWAKATIEALRGDVQDYEVRDKRKDQEIKELTEANRREIAAREAMERVVTGRDLLEALNTSLDNHHTEAIGALRAIHTDVESLVDGVSQLTKQERRRYPDAGDPKEQRG